MGDYVSNQGEITPKGVDGSIQLAAGGDLKAVNGVTVTDAGKLTAVIFSGDGGLLSNVGGGGSVGTLQEVTEQGPSTSNTVEFTNVTTGLVVSSNITVTGNVTEDYFVGDGSNVTNTVDVAQGTYGAGGSNASVITVSSDGRISEVSNIEISFPAETQTLQDVTDRGNVTSNTIQFTNTITSLTTSGNVAVNGATPTDAILSVKSDTSAVLALESETALSGIGFKSSTTSVGGNVPALGVNGDNIVFYTGVPSELAVTIDADKDMTVVGNVSANKIIGDGSELTNLVGGSGAAIYGNDSNVCQIVVNGSGQITGVSNVEISFPTETQTLQDVTDRGNVTSNTIEFTNVTTGMTVSSNITVTGNVTADYFVGDGSNVTNTVDVAQGTYGAGGSNVTTITISENGRISGVSNTEITRHTLSNVVNTGNTTSNTVEFTNVTTGISVTSNIVNEKLVGDRIIFTTSSGNVLTSSEYLTYSSNILTVDGGEGGIVTRKLEYINKFDTPPGVDISAGQPCYITNQGGSGEVQANLAINTNSTYMPAIGLALNDYNRNSSGYIVRAGRVFNIRDDVFENAPESGNVGSVVYVSSTSGKLTFDRPTGNTELIQNVGILLTASTHQNIILVQGAGRANDTPNFINCNQANVKYNLSITNGSLVESTNLYVTGNVYVDNVNANAIVTNGNMVCSNIYGNGQGLSNTVNSSIVDNTYGDGLNVPAITVLDGRITEISEVEITTPTLQQVTDTNNTTSNVVQFTNTKTSVVMSSNIEFTNGISIYGNTGTVSIGKTTAMNTQGVNGVAIGTDAGQTNQQNGSVAIGNGSGNTTQGQRAVSIGFLTGNDTQGEFGIAVGSSAGRENQGDNAVAIGRLAGFTGQGSNAIAIGYNAGYTNQDSNTIVLNATSQQFNTSNTDALYIKPVRNVNDIESNLLCYTSEGEIIDCQNVINSNLTVTGNVTADFFVGEGSNITNTVDVVDGTYGDGGSNVAAITILNGRIDTIANTTITTSNLQQVTDVDNVTTNSIEITNTGTSLKTDGLANIANLEVYGTHTEIADLTGTTLTVDAHNHSYRTANVNTNGQNITTLTINNFKKSSQMVIYITCTSSGSTLNGYTSTLTNAKSCHDDITMSVNDTVILAATTDGTTTYASACKFQ